MCEEICTLTSKRPFLRFFIEATTYGAAVGGEHRLSGRDNALEGAFSSFKGIFIARGKKAGKMKTIYVDNNAKTNALLTKGGVMFFTVERTACVYSGMVVLTPVENGCRRRAVYITGYKEVQNEKSA